MSTQGTRAFVTGGTGLIGRFTIESLLRRGVQVTMMVRAASVDARAERLNTLQESARVSNAGGTLSVVTGDLEQPGLGLDAAAQQALRAAQHVFHLAALYDISASDEALTQANSAGTRHLLEALAKGFAGVLHHVSSIAVAGDYQGPFTESMFDEGQSSSRLPSHQVRRRTAGARRCLRAPHLPPERRCGSQSDRRDGPRRRAVLGLRGP